MTVILSGTIHIEDNEETINNIEALKRQRCRPKQEKPQQDTHTFIEQHTQ